MKVVVVAETKFNFVRFAEASGYKPQETYPYPELADELAEAAGRLCYKSYDRPNPATAANADYIANILKQHHFSVLEHGSVTFYVSGVSRNLLVELERHRHLSFSVVSQRYVSQADRFTNLGYIQPPAFYGLDVSQRSELQGELNHVVISADAAYERISEILTEAGLKKKQVREAARSVLPGCVETEFLVTGNHRTWREILQKRMTPQADAEIYELARALYHELRVFAPNTYQDITDPEE